jgi:hypothetical protein
MLGPRAGVARGMVCAALVALLVLAASPAAARLSAEELGLPISIGMRPGASAC